MNQNLRILKRQDGISIVEALVSVSLTLIIALSISQISSQMMKSSRKMGFFEDAEKLTKEIQSLLSNQQTCTKEFSDGAAQNLVYDDTTALATTGLPVRLCPVDLGSSYIDISYRSNTEIDCSELDKNSKEIMSAAKQKLSR